MNFRTISISLLDVNLDPFRPLWSRNGLRSAIAALSLLLLTTVGSGQLADKGNSPEYRSYLAHIAAANNALRLSETAEAKRWLTAAPVQFRGWEWNYLRAKANQHVGSFDFPTAPVTALAVGPNGKVIATATADRTIRISNATTMAEVFRFSDPKLSPQSLAFSFDGKLLVAAFSGHTVIVWDVESKTELKRLKGNGKGITAAAFSPDGRMLASCSWDRNEARGVWGIVEIWDTSTGESIKKLEYGVKPLVNIAFSPNGKYLAVASWEVDKMAAIWDTSKWGEAETLETEGDEVYKAGQGIAFSPDSKMLAVGGKDSATRIWDAATRKLVHKLGGRGWGHAKWVNTVAFSPDGGTIATGSTDQTIKLWDVKTGEEKATLMGHTKGINAIAYGSDVIYTGSVDGTIKTWALESTGDATWNLDGGTYGIDFSTDGKRVATASWLGKVRIWDVDSGRELKQWVAQEQSANAVAYSPDQKRLASVGNDGKIKLWNADSAAEIRTFETVKGPQLISVAFTPDGRHVLSPSSNATAKLWEAETGREVRSFIHGTDVTYIAISPDSKWSATGGADGNVNIWETATGRLAVTVPTVASRITSLDFSRDSQRLAATSGRVITIIDVASPSKPLTLRGHDEQVNGAGFSPDGLRLASASSDETVKIWDTATGESLLSIPISGGGWNAAFHPDGIRLFILPLDRTIRVLTAGKASARGGK